MGYWQIHTQSTPKQANKLLIHHNKDICLCVTKDESGIVCICWPVLLTQRKVCCSVVILKGGSEGDWNV